jgi:CheY-like chemotaxis protein
VGGDRSRLQQVVWNLVANAIKFTPNGGRVAVRLERDGSHALLRVEDSGIGIAAAFLPHIFERFRQADSTSTRSHGGLGLGLAIVRHLVELHGGTVGVESPGEGRGSTFHVRLALLEEPTLADGRRRRRRPAGANADLPALDGIAVLVVDDERDALEAIATTLELCGASVTTAASAAEAIAAFTRRVPDVVLCDIGMPTEDGYAFIRRVRALGPARGGAVPAVALTAYAREEDRAAALEAGFDAHLAKPVEPAELAALVATFVGREWEVKPAASASAK